VTGLLQQQRRLTATCERLDGWQRSGCNEQQR
jgi:hypothetical protein